ncbi:MAG: DNA-binding protein WhiA [Anaerovoracaceae bacterium]|jgi:DNA-binding protein WhiA
MSFASETKTELAHVMPEKKCCMLAEIAGFIRVCGSIGLQGPGRFRIVITTDNAAVARHYKTLMKAYFSVDVEIEIGEGPALHKGHTYLLSVGPEQLSEQILRETGILMIREGLNYITDGIYDGLIRTKCCRKAYLRGAFLGAGTMTNPEKEYDFEIKCATEALAADLRRLIGSFVDLRAAVTKRRGMYITYVKDAGRILDLLAIMGAHTRYFAYEDVRLTKELRNEANRRSNCDQANIDKAVAASERQIAAIRRIEERSGLDSLPPRLRETARMRLAHPEASIAELGEMMNPPLKKSGINNRLRRLLELAEQE